MFNKIQYISQGNTVELQLKNIQEVLDGGCNWIQLRFKNASSHELIYTANEAKKLCDRYSAFLIINDFPDIAYMVNASGVHLGKEDMKYKEVRNILGNESIIGRTANTFEDIVNSTCEGCNYIGLGPYRFTITKEKLSPVLGIQGYQQIMNKMKIKNIDIPVYAIGGILLEDVSAIVDTGIYGVAFSGLLTNQPDKKKIIGELNNLLYADVNNSR